MGPHTVEPTPPPTPKKKNPERYQLGELTVYDTNRDGRFRLRHGDRIADENLNTYLPSHKKVQDTLKEFKLPSLWRMEALGQHLKAVPTAQERLSKSSSKKLLQKKLFQKQYFRMGAAMGSGDYKLFSRELVILQSLLVTQNRKIPAMIIESWKEEARMNSYIRDAAISLIEGRVDLAVMDLKFAEKYAIRLGVPWDPKSVAQYLQGFTDLEVPGERIREALQDLPKIP